ncbi:MAG: hypothetical protein PHP57_00595 [Sideroxydans sp.]|nr:hypothetical protein [Sideroxydans sp.]
MNSRLLAILITVCSSLVSCAASEKSSAPTPAAAPQQNSMQPTVNSIIEHPQQWIGEKVKVTGLFSGWQGKCKGMPPVSRSDWMLESDTSCIYVNGRLPQELSAIPPARGIGSTVIVVGKNLQDRAGKPYIQSESVIIVPAN